MPVVDIGIPAYRRPESLVRAVESALAQRQAGMDVRVFIVNDSPGDDLSKIAGDFGVELFNNERNRGLVGNWNRVVELAASPYLILLHDDDQLLPGMAKTAVAELEQNGKASMVFGGAEIMNAAGVTERIFSPFKKRRVFPGIKGVLDLVRNSVPVKAPAVCYRVEALRAAGGFSEDCAEAADIEMYLKLALAGEIICTGTILARYTFDASNLTFSRMFRERDIELLMQIKIGLCSTQVGRGLEERVWNSVWAKFISRHALISGIYRTSVGERNLALAIIKRAGREVKSDRFSSRLLLKSAELALSMPGARGLYRFFRFIQGRMGRIRTGI